MYHRSDTTCCSLIVPAAAATVVALAVSGCGLIQGMQDPPNACGGEQQLTYDGTPAKPGDPCGPCELDELQCDDNDSFGNTLECDTTTHCQAEQFSATGTTEAVELSWIHREGIDEYVLSRDGDELHRLDVSADTEPSEFLEYTDDSADSPRPEALSALQTHPGDTNYEVDLSWAPASVDAGRQHDYVLEAVPTGLDEPHRPGHEASAQRDAEDEDVFYEYRWWLEGSEPDDEWHRFDEVTGSHSDPVEATHLLEDQDHLPQASIGSLAATTGDDGYQIDLDVDDVTGSLPSTTFAVRANIEGASPGDDATTSRRPDVETFDVEWERRLETADTDSFETLQEFSVDATDQTDDGSIVEPTEDLSRIDVPEPSVPEYRLRVQLDDISESTATATTSAARLKPAVITGASDSTMRRLRSDGTEQWSYEDILGTVSALATGPNSPLYGATYTFDDSSQSYQDEFIHKLDITDVADGPVWTSDEHRGDHLVDARVEEMAQCPDGSLIVAHGSWWGHVYRFDQTGTGPDVWDTSDQHYGVAVDENCNVFVLSDDDTVRHLDFDNNDDIVQSQWDLEPDETTDFGALTINADGYLYAGTDLGTVYIFDSQDDASSAETFELPEGTDTEEENLQLTDLAVDDQHRLYVSGYHWTSQTGYDDQTIPVRNGRLHVYDLDSDDQEPELMLTRSVELEEGFYDSAAITSVAVDPLGYVYYATRFPDERVYQLPPVDDADDGDTTWDVEPIWQFDGHTSTPNPDPDEDGGDGYPEDCTADGVECTNIDDVAVTPGPYGAFSEEWDEVQNKFDNDD